MMKRSEDHYDVFRRRIMMMKRSEDHYDVFRMTMMSMMTIMGRDNYYE